MNELEQQEKLTQFTEFFTIKHDFSLNIEKITLVENYPYETFEAEIPLPFKLSSDNATIDQKALRSIQSLSGVAHQLVDYLNFQANKIDLLISYILSQHDDSTKRFEGFEFGGGGFSFITTTGFELADKLIVKLFLLDQNCAIYCHGEIIEKLTSEHDELIKYKVIFDKIREEDREVLVRTSLHLQAKQLQTLALQRNKSAKA